MTGLETWLKRATRHLSKDSCAQVRSEIQQHYESARETAITGGATSEEADRLALRDLGDAKTANCQYRSVLLTSAEARMLREGNWEARAVCSRPWLKRLLLAVPGAALFISATLFFGGRITIEWPVLVSGVCLLFAAPFLPVYTPSRGRVFRIVKWIVLLGMFGLAFGPDTLKWSWLLFSCLWPTAWIEWTRVSIRRKLPVAQWPRHLYL
jgi:hypothetical protein